MAAKAIAANADMAIGAKVRACWRA